MTTFINKFRQVKPLLIGFVLFLITIATRLLFDISGYQLFLFVSSWFLVSITCTLIGATLLFLAMRNEDVSRD